MARTGKVKRLVAKVARGYKDQWGKPKESMQTRGTALRRIVAQRIKLERRVGNVGRNRGGRDFHTYFK